MMKKNISLIPILSLCAALFAGGQSENDGHSIQFNEKDFDSIRNEISADLQIQLGGKWKVEAFGDPADLRKLNVFVRNGKLIIRRKHFIFPLGPMGPIRFDIAMPSADLHRVSLSSSGSAEIIGDLKADNTVLETSSSGAIKAGGEVRNLSLRSSSSGNIHFKGNCDSIDLKLSASGDITVNAVTDVIDAVLSSSGSVYIEGSAAETELAISSNGDFLGNGFTTNDIDLKISSSGNAEMTVTGEINATLSSSGNFYYHGDPLIGKIKTTSSGKLIKKN